MGRGLMAGTRFRGHYTPQGKRKLVCPECEYAWTSTRMRDPASCPKCFHTWYPENDLKTKGGKK